MASHLSMSLSESLQASLVIQHTGERKKQGQLLRQRSSNRTRSTRSLNSRALPTKEQAETSSKGLSIWMQGLLAMCFSGVEFSATFGLIYSLLFLQFIGVPTSLLTINGVIAGILSMVTLPCSGYFSDRGNNLVIRKMTMMMLVLLVYILGYVGLAICAAMKLDFKQNQSGIIHNSTHITHNISVSKNVSNLHHLSTTGYDNGTSSILQSQINNNIFTPLSFTTSNHSTPNTIILNDTDIISTLNHEESSVNSFGIIQVLGIISYALIDTGFDSSNSLCRAYILECSPPSTHNELLIMATISSSLGGLLCAFIGTLDLPGILESKFGVDGTSATMLFFGTGTLLYVVFSFSCTMVAGYYVYRRGRKRRLQDDNNNIIIHGELRKSSSHLRSNSSIISKSSDGIADETMNASAPLLHSDRGVGGGGGRNYSAILSSESSTVENPDQQQQQRVISYSHVGFDKQQYQKILSPWEHSASNVIHEDKPFETSSKSSVDNDNNDDHNNSIEEVDAAVSESEADDESGDADDDQNDDVDDVDNDNENHHNQEEESEISNVFAAMRASYSQSLTLIVHSSLIGGGATDNNNMQSRDATQSRNKSANTTDSVPQGKSIWSSKRLKVLLLAVFCVMGANLCVNMYSSVTLNIGVYHGDPTARPGTEERQRYNDGLRGGALGLLVMYATYSLVGVVNRRILVLMNVRRYFMLCQVVLAAVLLAFIFTKTIEAYFASMVALGFSRACAFTLAYIMVNKLIKDELSGNNDSSKPTQKIGQITALIGFILPSTYVFLASLMGPLMAALNSVWVPIIIAAIDSVLAVLTFGVFTVIKN